MIVSRLSLGEPGADEFFVIVASEGKVSSKLQALEVISLAPLVVEADD